MTQIKSGHQIVSDFLKSHLENVELNSATVEIINHLFSNEELTVTRLSAKLSEIINKSSNPNG